MNNYEVLPELKPYLDAQIEFDLASDLMDIRDFAPPTFKCPEGVTIENVIVDCKGHKRQARIYKPNLDYQEPLPGLFWIHGGGYVLGKPEVDDRICSKLAWEAGCIVVSIDYRLAPEHPYPAGLEDSYAGLEWMVKYADMLGLDRQRIAVAGPSAGGGLTAALSLLIRDRKDFDIIFQMPLYPMLDYRADTASSHEITSKNMPKAWNRENNLIAWDMYLGNMDREKVPYYASPALADDLSGLPPTYTCVGELDPFRDETIDYVKKLAQAGVQVEFHMYPGCYHGFDAIGDETPVSMDANDAYVKVLKKAFKTHKCR